jgi:hypothetical protein
MIEAKPAGATLVNITSASAGPAATVLTLPFAFPYYGRLCSTASITASGCVVVGTSTNPSNLGSTTAAHGQDSTTGAFPFAAGGDLDGLVSVAWPTVHHVNDGTAACGYTYVWTTGVAPNRHFVVSWDNAAVGLTSGAPVTLQCQLFETTGRIVFAHSSGWGGVGTATWLCGIDAPSDSRFVVPPGISPAFNPSNHDYTGEDIIFDPRTLTYSGRLLFDRIVSDASGIGNSTQANQPLGGLRVDLRRDGGVLANTTTTNADGTFTLNAVGVASSSTGTVTVLSQSSGSNVTTSAGGSPYAWDAVTSLSYATGSAVGTVTLGASADAAGNLRGAFNVARDTLAANGWASARTTDSISRLDVLVDPNAHFASDYQKAGASAALMHVGSALGGNSDAWDDAIITKTYARHVLASIAASPTTSEDSRFDAVTDTKNAFAEAFGYYLWAVISGRSTAIDGTSANTADVHDLESPTITVTKGPDVAACVAGSLYDLIDSANETSDAVDGTLTSDRVFQIVDGFTVAPTASTFLQAWVDAGYGPAPITRTFIGNGALVDDTSEPNDDRTETSALGTVGVKRTGLILNRFNEDWFSVTLPSGVSALAADAAYDRSNVAAVVGLEIRDAGGALLATGSTLGATGPVHAATGPVPAGAYAVGVRHTSGVTVPAYTVQAYVPLSMDAAPLRSWTVGRPYDFALGVTDGIAPYLASTVSASLPDGLGFNQANQHVIGTPSLVGSFSVTVQLMDGGTPANIVQRTQTVTIHDVLKLAVAPFVGFPLGKPAETTLPTTGGTPPFTLAMTSGELPSGLVFDPNSFHVTGTLTAGPSSAFELDGVDVAGSTDHVATRGVVAHPSSGKNVVADLVTGEDACGWWFDAVEGSTVSFTATTAKGHVKRVLAGLVLAPDRSAVLTGKIKTKLGSLTGSGFLCPASGRYYVIASSTDGEATQLLGNVHVAPPKAGKSKIAVFAPVDTTTVEVGALSGATLTLKFAGEKKTGLVAKVVSVTDPTGTQVPFVASVKATAIGGTLTMALPVGGTWTIVLGATSTNGNPGKLSYSYAVKQPKGVTYSAD